MIEQRRVDFAEPRLHLGAQAADLGDSEGELMSAVASTVGGHWASLSVAAQQSARVVSGRPPHQPGSRGQPTP